MVRTGMALTLALTLTAAAVAQEKGEVKLETVKYSGLQEAILKNRGKVVYVDFWHMNCPPCKAAMPHLVEMYAKHQKEGLEVVTVNVNVEDRPLEQYEKASLAFLQSIKANFRNQLLNESEDVWFKKLELASFPAVIVFDRQGRWTRFNDPIKNKDELKRFVEKLLREPAK